MIEYLMEIAQEEINKKLPDSYYTDDWQWNDTCFQFVIVHGQWPKEIISDPYRFCLDPDDVFERTGYEQLMDWIRETF